MSLLEVVDLHAYFDTPEGLVRAVDGVTFHVEAGETLGLVGESGCGKSVTARSLMRLIPRPGRIADGSVSLEGRDLLALGEGQMREIRGSQIALIPQDPMASLNPVLTIGYQLSEMLQRHTRLNRAAIRRRVLELLQLVGIPSPDQRLTAYPHQFSGGMRQRVMIAMALICEPKLVIADEITTALDVTIQAQILDLLKSLSQQTGVAFVLITHDLGVVADMAHRVHVMYAGQLVEKASTRELLENPKHPYTWGLLRSTPRLDEGQQPGRLTPIEGMPPNLADVPPGCRFEPRCAYRRNICRDQDPALIDVPSAESGHEARCWGTQDIPGGGWLIGQDGRYAETRLPVLDASAQAVDDSRSASHSKTTTVVEQEPVSAPPVTAAVGSSEVAAVNGRSAATASGRELLQVRGLSMHFHRRGGILSGGGTRTLRAVDGIDLDVRKGETLGLVGESGSGKSTAGRTILQVYTPTAGSVTFDGTDLTELNDKQMRKMRRRMQMIFQDAFSSFDPRMTVGDIIAEPLEVHGLARGSDKAERVATLLGTVGLSRSLAARYGHEFSGGQLQRIGIARALAVEPDFIVADESVSALDVSIQAQIINLLRDLQAKLELAYIFIAHDLAVVRYVSDRIAVMYLGRIVELADRNDLYQTPHHPYTEALISAVPNLDRAPGARRERIVLKGDIPNPENPPSGCRFHSRCQLFNRLKGPEICTTVDPQLVERSRRHWSACHFTEEIL